MLVLADAEGIFGSSMSDSSRAMVTEETTRVLVVIYCFENEINLEQLIEESRKYFEIYAGAMEVQTKVL